MLHSGIPVTLIPLDATKTIPLSKAFFKEFERRQITYEAKYCFQALKTVRDTWLSDAFHEVIPLEIHVVSASVQDNIFTLHIQLK